MWPNGVGENRVTNEEHEDNCFEESFQLTRGTFDRDGEGGGEALGMWYSSIKI